MTKEVHYKAKSGKSKGGKKIQTRDEVLLGSGAISGAGVWGGIWNYDLRIMI